MLTFGSARHIRRTGVSFLGGGCRIACLRTDACLLHSLRQQSAAAVVQQVSSAVVQQVSVRRRARFGLPDEEARRSDNQFRGPGRAALTV